MMTFAAVAAGMCVAGTGIFLTALLGQAALVFTGNRMSEWWSFPAWMAIGMVVLAPSLFASVAGGIYVGGKIAGAL